jgi:hypothetical protein
VLAVVLLEQFEHDLGHARERVAANAQPITSPASLIAFAELLTPNGDFARLTRMPSPNLLRHADDRKAGSDERSGGAGPTSRVVSGGLTVSGPPPSDIDRHAARASRLPA